MITRYALFEGKINDGQEAAFRAAVTAEVLPLWRQFPGALAVRVSYAVERDDGAPEFAMILAVSYRDVASVDAALASPVRQKARAATEAVLARFFTGRIHHHVMSAEDEI
jgi:quinol monooxygenase YgiN